MKKLSVAILLFHKIEVLDFAGPFEVFSTCGSHQDQPGLFEVYTVAEHSPVMARNGLVVIPTYSFNDCPQPDILLIPGGGGYTADGIPFGSRKEMNNSTLVEWVRRTSDKASLVLSVCTGALILAQAGLLEGLSATTHWKSINQLKAAAPNTNVVDDKRWVDNGKVITSAGVSAGIDMSLYVIAKLLGNDVSNDTAKSMQYEMQS